MSCTPKTDAFFFRTDIAWDDEVEFARQLERERNEAAQERERWKMQAEEKWGMRRELEELLGVKDTQCDEQFAKGLAALRDLIKERDEARNLADAAMWEADRLRSQLWRARDRAWKLACERNYWRLDCLEQCKLLAMGADREEKLRDALKYVAGLDTSQDASPQQCSAVAVAMEALR